MKNSTEKKDYFVFNLAERVFRFLWIATLEVYKCIVEETFLLWRYCGAGILFSYYLLFDLDITVAQFFGSDLYLEPNNYKLALTLFAAASGLIVFGFEKAFARMKLTDRLQKAFDYCDLKSGGLYPSFIKDEPIDEYVRQMKIFVPGIPLQRFKDKKIELEAHFNVNIVRMFEEENDKTRINLIYSMKDLPSSIVLENPESYVDGDIPIGKSYATQIKINLKDMGHMLANPTSPSRRGLPL